MKNFNDKVISEVRKDEQQRLKEAGDIEGAKSLKRSKYILTSSVETLREKDEKGRQKQEAPVKEESLFKKQVVVTANNREARYKDLVANNRLLFFCDLIKEKLHDSYKRIEVEDMIRDISESISICIETEDKHFIWFAKLLNNHFDGVVAHAKHPISAGKIEGINNRIRLSEGWDTAIPMMSTSS